jgi:hypothetical protein
VGIIKQIKCGFSKDGHNLIKKSEQMIHSGMGKMIVYKCNKCGKEKGEFV